MELKSFGFGILATLMLGLTIGFAIAAAGTITNNGDGTWSYCKAASETTWANYLQYYTENWPDKYGQWLIGHGCADEEDPIGSCDTPSNQKAYLEDHLDEILDGEYQGEKRVWTERQLTPPTGGLD